MEKHDCDQCDQRGKCDLEKTIMLIREAITQGKLDDATHYILSQGKDESLFKFIHLTIGELGDMDKVKAFADTLQRMAEPLGHKDKVVSMLRAMLMSYSRSMIGTALAKTQELGQALGIMVLTQDLGDSDGEADIPEHLKTLLDMPVVGGMQ